MVSRLRLQYCKVIIATSLVWFLLDVVLLMYYTDCTGLASCNSGGDTPAPHQARRGPTQKPPNGGLLDKLIPNGEYVLREVGGSIGYISCSYLMVSIHLGKWVAQ